MLQCLFMSLKYLIILYARQSDKILKILELLEIHEKSLLTSGGKKIIWRFVQGFYDYLEMKRRDRE